MEKYLSKSEEIDTEEFANIVIKALMHSPDIEQETKMIASNDIMHEIIYVTKQGTRFQVQITILA